MVTERLLYEERKASDRSSSEQRGAALTSKQRGSRRGPKCYNCQKYGHIQRNCTEKPQSGSRPHYESSIKSNRPFREYKKKRKYTEHKANAVCHENSSDSESEDTGLIICQDAFSVGKESDVNSD